MRSLHLLVSLTKMRDLLPSSTCLLGMPSSFDLFDLHS